jgi:undecaprenyl-diphosphatase
MLLITALLLTLAHFINKGEKQISFSSAFIIGIAQAISVIPGISRSGATIATGLLLKNKKNEVTRFSFLMVIIPILGAGFLDLTSKNLSTEMNIEFIPLVIGFTAAFISGLLACSWMIKIVRKGKLIYFAIYCIIIGLIAIFAA